MPTPRKARSTPASRRKPSRTPRALPTASTDFQQDEFSEAGSVPGIPGGLPGDDLSRSQRSLRELTWGEFDRHVQALARAARAFRPDAVVGLVHGGVFVGGALASALKAEFFPVRVTHRSRDKGVDRASDDFPRELKGRRVLIVDDVASSGDSLEFATRLARTVGVKAVKSAVLIARPGRFEADFTALTGDEFFVFPWDYQDLVEDHRFEQVDAAPPSARARRGAKKQR